jgi:isoquinoline 1-oxidoreductase
LRQSYTTSYIAHVPLDLAQRWRVGRRCLTVWTGTVQCAANWPSFQFRDQVRVLMPDTGSAYGGKHTGETAIQATWLARAAKRQSR